MSASDTCSRAEQVFADTLRLAPDSRVVVQASDYGREGVSGVLVSSSANEIVIRRDDERAGRLYVHFPRLGFEVAPA